MQLTVRQPSASADAKHYTTERLRSEYVIDTVFVADDAILTYSHFDRIIAGGVMPVTKSVELTGCKELASDTFLQRREMGVINIGMSIMGVDANYQKVVKGLVLLAAVIFDVISKRNDSK